MKKDRNKLAALFIILGVRAVASAHSPECVSKNAENYYHGTLQTQLRTAMSSKKPETVLTLTKKLTVRGNGVRGHKQIRYSHRPAD